MDHSFLSAAERAQAAAMGAVESMIRAMLEGVVNASHGFRATADMAATAETGGERNGAALDD